MPTFSRQLKSHLNPSSRRGGGGGGRCKTLPVALHESSAERVSPSPRHPQRRRRRRAPTNAGRGWGRGGEARSGAAAGRPPARPHPAAPAARAGGGRRQRRLLSRRRWWPDGLVQATAADAVQRNESNSITSFSSQEPAATATIRHESGFLPWRVAEPSLLPLAAPGLTPGPRRPRPLGGGPCAGSCAVHGKPKCLRDRCCLLCSVVAAAMRSPPRPSTSREGQPPAGRQMLQLFAVNYLSASRVGSSLERACLQSIPTWREEAAQPSKLIDLNRWSLSPAEMSFRLIVQAI
ncbi:uncharacterized protein LOC122228989 [Panthera leo]|uniref:uncharacterized protein LOC122228989 n=1 Tax=Panthera leo TaxID=9689 RepID=UPI001C6A61C8|nr:uncharacterized protein LOC122228989 [Panthera leo]